MALTALGGAQAAATEGWRPALEERGGPKEGVEGSPETDRGKRREEPPATHGRSGGRVRRSGRALSGGGGAMAREKRALAREEPGAHRSL